MAAGRLDTHRRFDNAFPFPRPHRGFGIGAGPRGPVPPSRQASAPRPVQGGAGASIGRGQEDHCCGTLKTQFPQQRLETPLGKAKANHPSTRLEPHPAISTKASSAGTMACGSSPLQLHSSRHESLPRRRVRALSFTLRGAVASTTAFQSSRRAKNRRNEIGTLQCCPVGV